MTDWIYALLLLALFSGGYRIMMMLDRALDTQVELNQEPTAEPLRVLLFSGEEEGVERLISEMNHRGIFCDWTSEIGVRDYRNYTYVLAISENDLDNLLLCHQARRSNPEVLTAAKCTRYPYRSVFQTQKIDWIVTGQVTMDAIWERLVRGQLAH